MGDCIKISSRFNNWNVYKFIEHPLDTHDQSMEIYS